MDHVMHRAREANTPFLSLFEPHVLVDLAKTAGLHQPRYVSAEDIYQRYFATRPDRLRAGHAEAFLVATCNATATTANTGEPPRTSPR
jgi:hypothetical protein